MTLHVCIFRLDVMKRSQLLCVSLLLLLILLDIIPDTQTAKVQYQYKKYTYRKKRDVSLLVSTICHEALSFVIRIFFACPDCWFSDVAAQIVFVIKLTEHQLKLLINYTVQIDDILRLR